MLFCESQFRMTKQWANDRSSRQFSQLQFRLCNIEWEEGFPIELRRIQWNELQRPKLTHNSRHNNAIIQISIALFTTENKDQSQTDDTARKKYAQLNENTKTPSPKRIYSTSATNCTTWQKQSYAAFYIEGNKYLKDNWHMGKFLETRL